MTDLLNCLFQAGSWVCAVPLLFSLLAASLSIISGQKPERAISGAVGFQLKLLGGLTKFVVQCLRVKPSRQAGGVDWVDRTGRGGHDGTARGTTSRELERSHLFGP